MIFKYSSDVEVLEGDYITVTGKRGRVERIFRAGAEESKDFSCFDTGGILLGFDDGDLQLWPWINEDLVFVDRKIG
jgi:hypothetical protein